MNPSIKSLFPAILFMMIFSVPCYAQDNKISIIDKNGQEILANDFISKLESTNDNKILINNKKMRIEYGEKIDVSTRQSVSAFHIQVGGQNLKEVQKHQKEAEDYLLKALGIKKKDACRLYVQIDAPKSMTGRYDYGIVDSFSFCPGGKLIERMK